jgi:hypothetical protein
MPTARKLQAPHRRGHGQSPEQQQPTTCAGSGINPGHEAKLMEIAKAERYPIAEPRCLIPGYTK